MADSTTTNYNFTLPEVGASEDSWGSKLNQNWSDLDSDLKAIDDKLDGTTPVTGIDINSGTIDGVTIGGTSAGAVTATNLTATGTTTLAGATTSADITFGDNDKAIFGAGGDLQIYHDTVNSVIKDAGTGNLELLGNNLRLKNADATNSYFNGDNGGAATIYYAGVEKLATTSTGIDVTGTATMDAAGIGAAATGGYDLTVGDFVNFPTNAANYLDFTGAGAAMIIRTGSGPTNAMQITAGNDISFYEDTGTTAKFFWDASAESLGIGTSSPAQLAHLYESASGTGAFLQTQEVGGQNAYFGVNTTGGSIQVSGANPLQIATNGSEAMRIDSSGNLLVGKTTTDFGVTGVNLEPDGSVASTRSSAAPANFNRLSTDGDIVRFFKNGTTVGSIGVDGDLYLNSQGSTGYLRNAGVTEYIWSASTFRPNGDNTNDLGTSGDRFKDLYLSGGVITSSDYRLKNDIQPMESSADKIKALNLVNFAWNESGDREDGFIAHELQAVIPSAVRGEKDAVNEEGEAQYQGVDPLKLIPVLTKALQEALTEIDNLKQRVSALENN